jgi:hypothetical protein
VLVYLIVKLLPLTKFWRNLSNKLEMVWNIVAAYWFQALVYHLAGQAEKNVETIQDNFCPWHVPDTSRKKLPLDATSSVLRTNPECEANILLWNVVTMRPKYRFWTKPHKNHFYLGLVFCCTFLVACQYVTKNKQTN